jgi:hypothetical protein
MNHYAEKIGHGFLHEMAHKGFKASLMIAERLVDNGKVHALPSGTPSPVFPVDALPGCPDDWVRGPGNYVCPVVSEKGLWFNWTRNDHFNTAVLPSVKGMNPITGQKLEGLKLEKYEDKCPIHDVKFKDGLFCEKCNYRWPPQSYVSYPNTLWWDGFRQPDGSVRQFFFTEDEARDIASLVIGKENTVPAFGFAFYEPVKPRMVERHSALRGFMPDIGSVKLGALSGVGMSGVQGCTGSVGLSGLSGPVKSLGKKTKYSSHHSVGYKSSVGGQSVSTPDFSTTSMDSMEPSMNATFCCNSVEAEEKTAGGVNVMGFSEDDHAKGIEEEQEVKSVAVGAGAAIDQELDTDTLKVSEWKSEPSAVMRLYFCFRKQWSDILNNGGVKDLNGDSEGFLKGLPVG